MSCAGLGVSDITVQSDQQPRIAIEGVLYRLGVRIWSPADVECVLAELYQANNAIAEIRSRQVLDFSYELKLPDKTRHRFRVNATAIGNINEHAIELSIRILPTKTPTPQEIGLTDAECAELAPANGLVVVGGPTGSGKTTTLAAIIRYHFENSQAPRKIITIDSPIEFNYHDLIVRPCNTASIIGQSEVGKHIKSTAIGVRSALRRNPDIIVIGETRDLETTNAMLQAALTGHLVYTTTHANTVAECMMRLLNGVSPDQYSKTAFELAQVIRFIVVQQLVATANSNKRVALREYLQFTHQLQMQMQSVRPEHWARIIEIEINTPLDASQKGSGIRKSLNTSMAELLNQSDIRVETAKPLQDLNATNRTSD